MGPDAPKPVYVLCGSDAFLIDEAYRLLLSRIIGDADPQTSVRVFEVTAELSEVLDELRTIPFLAPRRAVIIRDAEAFVSAHREAMEKYLGSPAGSSTLILIVATWRKNTRLAKLVDKIGQAIDCNAPEVAALHGWVVKAAADRGKKIASDAAELLLAYRGADLAALDGEMEKLSLYLADREQITVEDIEKLVTATTGPGAFALTNAISAGDTAAALRALGGALTRRGEEFRVLGMIAWGLRRALSASQQLARNQEPTLRMPPAQARVFRAMLHRRPLEVINKDFRKLLAADLAMKTGTSPSTALQELVIALCA